MIKNEDPPLCCTVHSPASPLPWADKADGILGTVLPRPPGNGKVLLWELNLILLMFYCLLAQKVTSYTVHMKISGLCFYSCVKYFICWFSKHLGRESDLSHLKVHGTGHCVETGLCAEKTHFLGFGQQFYFQDISSMQCCMAETEIYSWWFPEQQRR